MNSASKRSTTSPIIPKSAIEQATTALQDLPEKPKEQWSLREAVNLMRDSINDALSKGYSYEEVAEMLTSQGVHINVQSLKYYLVRGKKEEREALPAKTKTSRRTKASKAEDSFGLMESATESEDESDSEAQPSTETTLALSDFPKSTRRRSTTRTESTKTRTPRTSTRSKSIPTSTASDSITSADDFAAADSLENGASAPESEAAPKPTRRPRTTTRQTAAKSKSRTSTRAKSSPTTPKTRRKKGESSTDA